MSRGRGHRAVVGLVVLVVLAAACQPSRLRAPVELPDGQRNFPDPSVIAAEGQYFAYSTNSFTVPPRNIQVMSSPDLEVWNDLHEALPTPPSWAWTIAEGGEFWAPTVERYGSTYRLYFSAKHRSAPSNRPGWCIGIASSSDPNGPFTPAPAPLLCQVLKHITPSPLSTSPPGPDRGVIDPQVYRAPNGDRHLLFKANDNPWQLWSARLHPSGTAFAGQGNGLVRMGAQADVWEYSPGEGHRFTILENPSMDHNPAAASAHGFGYYLYYSGGDWRTSAYGTGVAACRTPSGPCVRATSEEPWLASRGAAGGPGGLSVFRDLAGQRRVAYHSWERGQPLSNGRRLHVEPLGYVGDEPELLDRRPSGTIALDLAPAELTVAGVVHDPDRAGPVDVVLTVDGATVATERSGADGATTFLPAALDEGSRQVCLHAVDDNGLGLGQVACRSVDVPPVDGPDPTFWDVSWRHPFLEDVEWMAVNGIASGYDDLGYRPAQGVSRQAMAAFVHRLAGAPPPPVGAPTFVDVSPSHSFATAISWLAGTGVSTGYADGTFRPGQLVTRQAMAAFVHRAAGAPLLTTAQVARFTDVSLAHPFSAEVEWMASTGISAGFDDGSFRPGATVSRQAMSAFLRRLADGPGIGV